MIYRVASSRLATFLIISATKATPLGPGPRFRSRPPPCFVPHTGCLPESFSNMSQQVCTRSLYRKYEKLKVQPRKRFSNLENTSASTKLTYRTMWVVIILIGSIFHLNIEIGPLSCSPTTPSMGKGAERIHDGLGSSPSRLHCYRDCLVRGKSPKPLDNHDLDELVLRLKDVFSAIPILLPLCQDGALQLLDLVATECSAKELVIALQETTERLRNEDLEDDDDDDDDEVPGSSSRPLKRAAQTVRLINLYAKGIHTGMINGSSLILVSSHAKIEAGQANCSRYC